MPIDWMDVAKASVTTIVTSTALSVGIVWGFKEVISKRLKGSIGLIYDSKLTAIQNANAVELEKLKAELVAAGARTLTQQSHELQLKAAEQTHELQMKAKEFELKYTVMQQKRAKIVAKTYAALYDLLFELMRLSVTISKLDDAQRDEETRKFIIKTLNYNNDLQRNIIYFPPRVAIQLDSLRDMMTDTVATVSKPGTNIIESVALVDKVINSTREGLTVLATEMRVLLGADK